MNCLPFDTKLESNFVDYFEFYPPKEKREDDTYYSGLDELALSTSFIDYFSIYNDLKGDLIDYGAGYCKGSLLFSALGTLKKCYSFEIKSSRVEYALKLMRKKELDLSVIKKHDLLKDKVPMGDNYLIYLPLGDIFFRLLSSLYKARKKCVFYLIESHGDMIDYIEYLSESFVKLDELEMSSIRYRPKIYKYLFTTQVCEDIFYQYFTHFDEDKSVDIIKDDKEASFKLRESLPLKYNNKMCIELFEHKRILDHTHIKLK